MNRWWWLAAVVAATRAQPLPSPILDETLNYAVNWPSGLSLGEAQSRAARLPAVDGQPERWEFRFSIEAAIPGFQVAERYRSVATAELCGLELEKNSIRGKRKAIETTTFDARRGVLTRATSGGGGKSEVPIAACAKDGVTFLYHLRQQLRQGRIPSAQKVYLGAGYDLRFQYAGVQTLAIAGERIEADRLLATFKGPASEMTFEIFVARDEARTPVLIRAPLALGTFSLELVR